MKTKQEIVENWLPRYTKRPLHEFTKFILLTNFQKYVEIFAAHFNVPIVGVGANMPNASANGITIVNFGMGSANAATVMDLLSAVSPTAVLFLGKCGGLKEISQLGDYILPIAAIRGEGTSNDYFPVPSLPAFSLLRAVSSNVRDFNATTGPARYIPPRVWEYDEVFKLLEEDTGYGGRYGNGNPLHLRLCQPYLHGCPATRIRPAPYFNRGKSRESDRLVTERFVEEHVKIGIKSLSSIINQSSTIKHLRFDW